MNQAWWKESVVYQIYPRSFQDSNGDGIGDLRGIIDRLDYIQALGADVIWLCPICRSPNADNGYDISDYRHILEEYGTMRDFADLLAAVHGHNMRLVMDLAVNDTSDEHEWFIESRASADSPFREFYLWRQGIQDGPPNNWGSFFGGSAWEYDKRVQLYYLHLFSKKQPELNWDNPRVREGALAMMTWWLDKGIDGFRMAEINLISKDLNLLDGEVRQGEIYGDPCPFVFNGPRVHEYLQEMHNRVFSRYDIMTVGETPHVTVEDARHYAGFQSGELDMVLQSELMGIDDGPLGKWSDCRFKLGDLRRVFSKWQTGLHGQAWNSLFWSNHDQPRAVSRFGCDSDPLLWEKSAKMLAVCLHMQQGTPYIYQGEELGMTNCPFQRLEDCRDIESRNAYNELVHRKGVSRGDMMRYIRKSSRDNARTPMQWNDSPHAGFTQGKPWIEANPNYTRINAAAQREDPNSIFHFYQRLIQLRHTHKVIIYGDFRLLLEDHDQIFAYTRSLDEESLLVLCNFSDQEAPFAQLPGAGMLLIGNYDDADPDSRVLLPYETRVYRC